MTIDSGFNHITVLLDEAVEALAVRPDGCYLDGTFGRGGHSRLILQKLGPEGRLLGFDKDPQAIATGQALAAEDGRFVIVQRSFAEMGSEIAERGLAGKVDGVLLDLGVSSPQLDDPERGFSFMNDGPLDMRMDPDRGISAAEFVNTASQEEIARVFKEYGEERFSGRPFIETARRLCLYNGINCAKTGVVDRFKMAVVSAARAARAMDIAGPEDFIVVTAGVPFNTSGTTNILRVAPCEERLIFSGEPS